MTVWMKSSPPTHRDYDWKGVCSVPAIQTLRISSRPDYGMVPTKASLHTRTITKNPNCPFYQTVAETREHVLRNCVRAREVWDKCILLREFFTRNLETSVSINFNSQRTVQDHHNISWSALFSFVCWRIWIRRN